MPSAYSFFFVHTIPISIHKKKPFNTDLIPIITEKTIAQIITTYFLCSQKKRSYILYYSIYNIFLNQSSLH